MAIKKTIDGNTAASYVAYAFSDVSAVYPITPSTPMGETADEWAAAGKKNLFGQPIRMAELQSEAGAAGAVHGSLAAGALTTTFTASQGLLLMIPNMYKIAGELLPCVFHVSARALAAHALSIFGDHQDVMACRQTGFAMLASNSVQEVMDLALVAHLATLEAKVPFLHFFDGFRTSHEINKIEEIPYEEMDKLLDRKYVEEFRARALNPEHPVQYGTAQNPDIYFQNREAANKYYNAVPEIVEKYMAKVAEVTGRPHHIFDYVGAPDATDILVMMGSGAEVAEETINYLLKQGKKVGLVKVHLYRPFSVKHFVGAIPASVKNICVLDRTKEAGSLGEPLYLDVVAALAEAGVSKKVIGGRYGLGSKEFTPSMVLACYKNLAAKDSKNHFTVGIDDDVTGTSLVIDEKINVAPEGTTSCMFYGLGSDGTVGANKNSIKIIGDNTDLYAQGYFSYDSKKSGGLTVSHLRFGPTPIQSCYLIEQADFLACHNQSYVTRYDMLSHLKEGGTFLLNSSWTAEQMEEELPASVKQQIAKKHIKFYNIDGLAIAKKAGAAKSTNMVMQAAFFKLADIIPYADAEVYMKKAVVKSYGKKGEAVVNANYAAIDNAIAGLEEIKYPESWANATTGAPIQDVSDNEYYENFIRPIAEQEGDSLPVSAFDPTGKVPVGTTQYEKRGVAVNLPEWIPENCIQCNQCALACPHAVIRPQLIDENAELPADFAAKPAIGVKGAKYHMEISPLDCSGCGVCAGVCPAKEKALVMKPAAEIIKKEEADYEISRAAKKVANPLNKNTVKGSQFEQPLFEFSGACAGCGETPYVKLITQLFGDRMMIANATGCSSIYGGSAPTCPYTTNDKGHGPAWANSLFEDNAEFGYGFNLAVGQKRNKLKALMEEVIAAGTTPAFEAAAKEWIECFNDGEKSKAASAKVVDALDEAIAKAADKSALEEIKSQKDQLVKKSIWIFGGDGWAYDIGYGGLDHVLASGEDVNVLVLDTEVYSNTGGQASKSSPTAAVAKFAAGGKRVKKKDLGMMAMSYGYVYVAQVGMGANPNQLLKAVSEAEAYHGPSLIIAYAPCINHGINMSKSQEEIKKAVECGYWQLYRFNPELKEQGKNPFILDSKDPTGNYQEFIRKETRYASLMKVKPEIAEELYAKNEEDAKERLAGYKELANRD